MRMATPGSAAPAAVRTSPRMTAAVTGSIVPSTTPYCVGGSPAKRNATVAANPDTEVRSAAGAVVAGSAGGLAGSVQSVLSKPRHERAHARLPPANPSVTQVSPASDAPSQSSRAPSTTPLPHAPAPGVAVGTGVAVLCPVAPDVGVGSVEPPGQKELPSAKPAPASSVAARGAAVAIIVSVRQWC